MRIYLDTSVFVKRYCEEEGSDVVNDVFESGNEILSSYWTLAEAIAAIDRKVAKRQISEEERDFAISVLFSDVFNRVTFVKISNEFIEAIIEMILAHHISTDDALQLFSCIISFSPIFLASDRALIRAAKEEGLKAFDVENSEDNERLRRLLAGNTGNDPNI
ncbi:MAG: type II toxin-antitoxin system VapC family toxin [Methanophagales archaeon]|nr:type II toxin-antitoxin system VapC family toxin [Methanophagales archaeon]